MSGHLSFPKIDASGAPASLSKYFLTDLLRTKLGFDGLIITDDMMMNGDTLYAGSLTNAFYLAIAAGNDILISSTTARLNEPLWTVNLDRMRTDASFRERVKDAAYRVLKAKLDYFKSGNAAPLYPDAASIGKYIPDKEGEKFFLEQACRSITLYKKGTLPLSSRDAGRVLFVGSLSRFFSEGKRRYASSGDYRFSSEPGPNETQYMCDHILESAAAYNTVICCVSNAQSARIARTLKGSGKRIVIFSIMSPEYALDFSWADSVVMGYSWSSYTFDAMFGALAGEYEAQGTLPFKP